MAVEQRIEQASIGLGAVVITERARELILEALDRGEIGQGPLVRQFEEELARWFGVRHAIAVATGTAADAIALAAVHEASDGRDEVIVPALTFVAQVNALYYNHLRPVFVDAGEDFEIDVERVEEQIGPRTLAIMPTHLLGRPARMDAIVEIARRHDLWVIEDACEALGSRFQGRLCGTIGDAGCFSFFVSHSVTTGEGGVILTNSDDLGQLARSLRNHGRLSDAPLEKFRFPRRGFSAKINQMEAAIGLGVMPVLDDVLEARRKHMLTLNRQLGDHFAERPGEWIVPHGYPVLFPDGAARNRALLRLHERGIEARPLFSSIPTQEEAYAFLGYREGEFPVAERFGRCGLYVPCHQNLSNSDLLYLADCLQEVLGQPATGPTWRSDQARLAA